MNKLLILCTLILGTLHPLCAFEDPSVFSNRELYKYIDELAEQADAGAFESLDFEVVLAFVRRLGQIDRTHLNANAFLAHLQAVQRVRHRFDFEEELTLEEFNRYLLPLRIRYESTARPEAIPFLQNHFLPLTEGRSIPDAAETVFEKIRTRMSCDPAQTYILPYRGDLDPLTTWRGKQGDEIDLSILACASLRSIGIPARLVFTPNIREMQGGKVWVEFLNEQKQWTPWVPTYAEKLATRDHKPALRLSLKGRCGVIFADPSDPMEVTDQYMEVKRVRFSAATQSGQLLEHGLAFEVG